MKKIILFFTITLLSCTNEEKTIKTLQNAGFKDIKTTGYSFWACSEDDYFSTGFEAKNPVGEIVNGTVCCGLFKSCTIRY